MQCDESQNVCLRNQEIKLEQFIWVCALLSIYLLTRSYDHKQESNWNIVLG